MDDYIQPLVPTASRSTDKELARIQTFILDAVAPLTALLEAGNKEERDTIPIEEVMKATTSMVELIGNASARMSCLRREKLCSNLNKVLQSLARGRSCSRMPHLISPLLGLARNTLTRSKPYKPPSLKRRHFFETPPPTAGGLQPQKWLRLQQPPGERRTPRFRSRGGKYNPQRKENHSQRPQNGNRN